MKYTHVYFIIIILILLFIYIANYFSKIEEFTTLYVSGSTRTGKYNIRCEACNSSCSAGKELTGSDCGTVSKTNRICSNCPAGKYKNTTGSTACINCPAGKYQNHAGQAECINCPAGQYQNAEGQAECINCPAGKYQNTEGQSNCNNCPAGQYQNGTGKTNCNNCPAGQYQNAVGQSNCNNCPKGQYQNGTGKTSCIYCPEGQYQNAVGQTSCKNNLVYDFSSKTSLSSWKTYASQIGGSTNITHYYTAHQLRGSHGREHGVFTGGTAVGYFQLRLPSGYNKIKIRYRNVYNKSTSSVKLHLGGKVIRQQKGLSNAETTPWFSYNNGDYFKIDEDHSIWSASLRLELTYNDNLIYDFSTKTSLSSWKTYASQIGGSTNITHYYTAHQLRGSHGREHGVFKGGPAVGYFELPLPSGYKQIRVTYRNVYNHSNGAVRILIGGSEKSRQTGLHSAATTTGWYNYSPGARFRIEELNTSIWSANLNIEIRR